VPLDANHPVVEGRARIPRRWREGRFLALAAACLLAVGGGVRSRLGEVARPAAGHRNVDPELLSRKLRDGTIVGHEAMWYRPAGGDMAEIR
jgi:hypothetical protein